MSLDPTTAYNQGVQAAVDASSAARSLGLAAPTIIYSDMEGYHTGTPACKTAVLEYEHGWLNQMKLYEGRAAGIYGSSSGTEMQSFATGPNPPDDIWFAEWNCSDSQPCVSVWNTSFIQPTSWATQPPYGRVHQFANWPCLDQVNHSDCVLFNGTWREIDQNCAWGLVAGKGWGQDPAFPNCPGAHP
ncbi:MAG TPA: glycoside hydrolase domain-containing protein [Candidatus Limnocylindria bacterium]|nr:glycoside hydrolase domain-containing protein [Candidatus Limnocylindria bacterium]